MDNMANAIEGGFRGRKRHGSEDIPGHLPSQEEDVFSFKQLQLHLYKKESNNRQEQQMTQRTSMYEKIIAELSQNSNSDHLQLVGSSQDPDKNVETENLSQTSSMNGNNGFLKRHLSNPSERFSTYDRIVKELSTDTSKSLDGPMSVIGGNNNDNINTNNDGTGLTMNDYGQLQNNDFEDVSRETHVPPLIMPNFTTLDMLNEETNTTSTVGSEPSGINIYSSKEMKNYVNNMSKLQVEGTYDDHLTNKENEEFSQICDQNLVNQVSSLSIYPTALSKDDSIVNNQLRSLNSYNLDSNGRSFENSNQHISSSWSNNGKQNDSNSYDLLSTDGQESQSSYHISGPHTAFSSLELSNKQCDEHNNKERKISSTSLLEYLSTSTQPSRRESTTSQYICEHDGAESIAESSSKDWGVSEAIKGIIVGVFGETATQTSPERAQQVKEIADLNSIFRY